MGLPVLFALRINNDDDNNKIMLIKKKTNTKIYTHNYKDFLQYPQCQVARQRQLQYQVVRRAPPSTTPTPGGTLMQPAIPGGAQYFQSPNAVPGGTPYPYPTSLISAVPGETLMQPAVPGGTQYFQSPISPNCSARWYAIPPNPHL